MRSKPVLGFILAVVTMGAVPPLSAQESRATVKRGEALLTRNCARCHATGTAGLSPHPEAPPFRTLSRRYPVEGLAEALVWRFRSPHHSGGESETRTSEPKPH